MRFFRRRMAFECAAQALLEGLPHLAKHFRDAKNESDVPLRVEHASLVSAVPAMWLFLLCGSPLGQPDAHILQRAFCGMWELLPAYGIDVSATKRWFDVFNATLLLPESGDRVEMVALAFARELRQPELGGGGTPDWLLVLMVSTTLSTMDKFRIV